eukprot:g1837.t1
MPTGRKCARVVALALIEWCSYSHFAAVAAQGQVPARSIPVRLTVHQNYMNNAELVQVNTNQEKVWNFRSKAEDATWESEWQGTGSTCPVEAS